METPIFRLPQPVLSPSDADAAAPAEESSVPDEAPAKSQTMGQIGQEAPTETPTKENAPMEPEQPAGFQWPDWVPEKFRVEDKYLNEGQLEYRSLAEDINTARQAAENKMRTRKDHLREEVETELAEKALEREKDVPKTWEDYAWTPAKNLLPEGVEASIGDPKDPLYQWFQKFAHDNRFTNKQFSDAITDFVRIQTSQMPDTQHEIASLGEHGELRVKRVNGWLNKNLSAESYKVFAEMPIKGDVIRAVEELMNLAGQPQFTPKDGGNSFQEQLTRQDLRKMMADPRYSGVNPDPEYVQKVRAGWRQIAPGGA